MTDSPPSVFVWNGRIDELRVSAMDVTRERVRGAEALTEHAAEVEHEAQGEPRVGESKPLKRA